MICAVVSEVLCDFFMHIAYFRWRFIIRDEDVTALLHA